MQMVAIPCWAILGNKKGYEVGYCDLKDLLCRPLPAKARPTPRRVRPNRAERYQSPHPVAQRNPPKDALDCRPRHAPRPSRPARTACPALEAGLTWHEAYSQLGPTPPV